MTDKKLEKINKIKNMVLNDEWETYSIKLSVLEPFEDKSLDVRVQGNKPGFDNQVMVRNLEQAIDWMPHKYGKPVKPFEILIKMRQVDADVGSDALRFEYGYSMKSFGSDEIVYEREPHRIIELQDPEDYRGQVGLHKLNAWNDTHKIFIVNGRIEKFDGNIMGGFYFNRFKDSRLLIGTYPLSLNDILRLKKAGVTAIFNIQTGTDMSNRGIFWP